MNQNKRIGRWWIKVTSIVTIIEMLFMPLGSAATQYWDTAVTGGHQGGNGTWDTTGAPFWGDLAGTGALANWTASNGAVLDADSATIVTLGGNNITAGVIQIGNSNFTLAQNASADRTLTYTRIESSGVSGTQTLTLDAASSRTLTLGTLIQNGSSGGTVALSKTNAGKLTLSSANTYSGGTTLTAGALNISTVNSVPTIGPLYTGGTGPLGTGTFTINGASTINTDAARTIANDLAITTSDTVNFSPTTSLTINGQNQSIAGGPTLNVTVATTFGAYPMNLNSSATISGAGAVSFNGGLTVGGSGAEVLTDSSSTTLTIAGPLTLNKSLTINGTHGAITIATISETIVGSSGATLTFSDGAAGNGATTYTTGPLLLGGDFALYGNSTVTTKPAVTINGIRVANGVTSNFTLDNANTTYSFGLTGTTPWIVGGNLTLTYGTPGTTVAISGASFLVGGGNLTFANGTTTLTIVDNSYLDLCKLFTGTITVGSAATVTLSGGDIYRGVWPINGALALATSGTPVLDINAGKPAWVGSLSGGNASGGIGEIKNTGASVTLVIGHDNRDATYSGKITATTPGNLALMKVGTGTQTFDGSVVNTFTGGLNVSGGTLKLDFANLGTPTDLINSGNGLILGGGTLFIKGKNSGTTSQTLGALSFSSGGSAILIDPFGGTSTTLTLGTLSVAALTGTSALFGKPAGAGSGTTTITTTTAPNGTTGIYIGRFVYSSDGGTTVDWLTTASGSSPYTLSAYSSYSALNTATGSDTANSRITANTTLGGSRTTCTLKIENPGAGQSLDLGSYTLTLDGGGGAQYGGGLLVTGTNPFTISGTQGGTRLSGGSTGSSYDLVIQQYNTGGLTISAVIGNFGANVTPLTKVGPGTLTLSGVNTYTGATYLNGGILSVSADNNLGSSGILYLNGGTLKVTSSFAATRAVSLLGNGGTVNVDAGVDLTLNGGVSGGSYQMRWLTKKGAGSLTLGTTKSAMFLSLSEGQLNLNVDDALSTPDAASRSVLTIAGDGTVKLDNTSTAAKTMGNNNYNFNANFTMVGAASGITHDLNLGTGAVMLGGTGSNRTITVGDGSNIGILTVGGAIFDGGKNIALTKAGAGTLVLSSTASTYSGGTTLSTGTLALGADSASTIGLATGADPAPGVVYGPVGIGTLTLNANTTLRSSDTGARYIH
ncbi:MAG: autotransporter-associated beta strand repeat-containing protein, partial [bacterium]